MALAVALGACEAPDAPARLSGGVPDPVVRALAPDSLRSVEVGEGVWYHYLWSSSGPFAIHLAEIDLSRCALGLDVATARAQEGKAGGHEWVSAMAARHTRTTLVAVNGDFFTPEGLPLGPEVQVGEARRGRSRPALAWRDGGGLWIGTVGVADGVLDPVGWPTGADVPEVDVIGGFPELLDGGVRVGDLGVGGNPAFAASRHPRTAVGVDRRGRRLWLVVVDGRQGEYSTGMTLPELASLFEGLGVTDALNLDGGGSSIMVVLGRTASRPSDPQGERPVANALLLVEDPATCR
jgi:hypothetical protein